MTASVDDLVSRFGIEAATALARWAAATGREISLPAREISYAGYTGARLAGVYVTDPLRGTQLVVVKVLPRGEESEASVHLRAVREAPEPFRPHLVPQVFDPVWLPTGEVITFQQQAGHSRDWRPMTEVPPERLVDAGTEVVRSLIGDWNGDFGVRTVGVRQFVADEIADNRAAVGRIATAIEVADEAWVTTVEDGVLPNPLHLLSADSVVAGERVDLTYGRSHRDLHARNVLMRQRHGRVRPETFILVDLMTYTPAGQLGRDPVRLLLSLTDLLLAGLSEADQQPLLAAFVRPDADRPGPALPLRLARAVHDQATALLSRCGEEVWRLQYLLCLVSEGLAMAGFTGLPPARRWWFLRLAGHATRELLAEAGVPIAGPVTAPALRNPFGHGALAPRSHYVSA
jgi:hypothetical protein